MSANLRDHFAERVNGRIVKVSGIEYRLEIKPSMFRAGGFSTEVIGHPTAKGKRTKLYREEKRSLGDDWSASWTELPDEISALWTE